MKYCLVADTHLCFEWSKINILTTEEVEGVEAETASNTEEAEDVVGKFIQDFCFKSSSAEVQSMLEVCIRTIYFT